MNHILIAIRLARMLCMLLFLFCLSGCGVKYGGVAGKVTYNGKPLPFGTVTFHMPSGKVETAMIQPGGEYVCTRVEVGQVRITVQTPSRLGKGRILTKPKRIRKAEIEKKEGAETPVSIVPIPLRYDDPDTSGITVDIPDTGQRTFDITLTP